MGVSPDTVFLWWMLGCLCVGVIVGVISGSMEWSYYKPLGKLWRTALLFLVFIVGNAIVIVSGLWAKMPCP
jgi:hypothetical protein